jgi:catechol-2,3-dioxygenase
MIKAKRLNAVMLTVRDLEISLDWYAEHFGFERLYEVEGGILIGAGDVELVLTEVDDPAQAGQPDKTKDICMKLFALEISHDDLIRVEEEFCGDNDIVRIDHPKYKSRIVCDPDGHAIELYVNKPD